MFYHTRGEHTTHYMITIREYSIIYIVYHIMLELELSDCCLTST